MHTMVVRMSIDTERADEAARHLREDVVRGPASSRALSTASGCAAPTGARE